MPWRLGKTVQKLGAILEQHGVPAYKVIGKTGYCPASRDDRRGYEIECWLKDNMDTAAMKIVTLALILFAGELFVFKYSDFMFCV